MCKIKICGVRSTDTVSVLNELTPDYVGFILSKGFARTVDECVAASIRGRLNGEILTVGVFVNEPCDYILHFLKTGIINVVQLHGDEDEAYIDSLKKATSVPIIKAAGVKEGSVSYPLNCDMVLLDSFSSDKRGGTGQRIAWRRYDEIDKPVILAGGLNGDNVAEAIKLVSPYCVDASGGLESGGVKDPEKIASFIEAVRNYKF